MGEELLSSPDAANNGGGAKRPAPVSVSEVFDEHCAYYLSIGMTWEQFWFGDAQMVRIYRKAQRMKNKRENQQMWMQGLYYYKALLCVSPILHAFAKAGTEVAKGNFLGVGGANSRELPPAAPGAVHGGAVPPRRSGGAGTRGGEDESRRRAIPSVRRNEELRKEGKRAE